MKMYFLSAQPAQLTVNGCYFGVTDTFERSAELSLKERNYVLFQPQGAGAIGFFLEENIRFSPPRGCAVYLLRDGIAVYARDFPPTDFSLRVFAQLRDRQTLVTLYQQGTVQLSVQSEFGFFIATLPYAFANSSLEIVHSLVFVKAQGYLAIVNFKGEILLIERILEYAIDGQELRVRMPLFDGLGRTAECRFLFKEQCLERTAYTLTQTHTVTGETDKELVQNELLPFAFFESVRIGAEYAHFLSDALQEKAQSLKTFLGEFTAVSITHDPCTCGLVRQKASDLFELAYYTVEIADGKIVDIKG